MTRMQHVRSAFSQVFSAPAGWIAAAAGCVFVLLTAMILSNLKLLGFILGDAQFSVGLKLSSALQAIWTGRLAFRHEGGEITFVLALLFGLNVALLTHYMRRQARLHHAASASAIGMLVGLLGVGCAACGSALFASLLGTGATVGLLASLPFRGQEFSWLGILLVLASTFSLARKIAEPETCPVPLKNI